MFLTNYLKEHQLLPPALITKLRDKAALSRTSAFCEVWNDSTAEIYEIDYMKLEEWALAAASEASVPLIALRDTKGYEPDLDRYGRIGGVSDHNKDLYLLLKETKTGKRMIVTNRPDDPSTRGQLKNHYNGDDYTYCICTPAIYQSLYSFYIEPLIVAKTAASVSMGSAGFGALDAVQDSEGRKLWRNLMNIGIERHASDIHFIPMSNACRILYRIDGTNVMYTEIPLDVLERVGNILKNEAKVQIKNPKDPIDGKARYSPSGAPNDPNAIDIRLSIIPAKFGSDINIRYLPSKLYTFEEIGMSPENIKRYKGLLELPSGLIVQVGPTGSGKSTTLYAGLKHISQDNLNIITAEDPVEILMDGISQIDVDDTHLTFEMALKAMLRHDPDVIVVGELRDKATAELAVRAANTGHLVLTSLHTNDSIGAFERMINMGVDNYALGEVVAAVMGQRLVRRLCPHCKKPYKLKYNTPTAAFYGLGAEEGEGTFYRPHGCVHCKNTGYDGRVAINEILIVDSDLRLAIQRHSVRRVFEDHLRKRKFRTMYHDGLQKAIDGITSLEELTQYASDAIAFKG